MKDSRWLDEPQNVQRIFVALVAVCALLLLADLAYHKHTHFDFEGWFGFFPLFGFFAYVGIVTVAKGLRKILKRDEDYYD